MAKLKFKEDNGQPTDYATGMYSKDKEYVDLSEECHCQGAVETWLQHLLEHMQATVRHIFSEAVVTYEDKPREQWLFDYPAQVALASTQVWWTTEVNLAFQRLEEGYENAMKEYYKKQVSTMKHLCINSSGCHLQ